MPSGNVFMHDTLNGLIAHSNHNIQNIVTSGAYITIGGGGVVSGEVAKRADPVQVSWLANHYLGVLSGTDCLQLLSGVLVVGGIIKMYFDLKILYNQSKASKKSRK